MMSLYNVIRLHIAELYENEQELKALQKEKPHYKEYFFREIGWCYAVSHQTRS